MYTQHFGLSSEPFGLTPDPAFLFPSEQHREALAALQIGLEGRRGLIVMVGEVGTGKTTLLYSLLPQIAARVNVAYVSNTKQTFDQILAQALADFGADSADSSERSPAARFREFVLSCAKNDAIAALVIDEAQNLDDECLENLRLLLNVETFTQKLLQIILVGQPELVDRLSHPHLRQLRERIGVYCEIKPLSWRSSRDYVAHRLACAGGSLGIFTRPAVDLLLWQAGGIPRRINILCHNAMLFAYGRNRSRVSMNEARSAIRARLRPSRWGRRPRPAQIAVEAAPEPTPAVARERHTSLRLSAYTAAMGGLALMLWNLGPSHEETAPEARRPIAQLATIAAIAALPPLPMHRSAIAPAAPPAPVQPAETTGHEMSLPRPPDTGSGNDALKTNRESDIASNFEETSAVSASVEDGQPRIVRVEPGANLSRLTRAVYGRVGADLLAAVRRVNPRIDNPDRIGVGDLLIFPAVAAGQPKEQSRE